MGLQRVFQSTVGKKYIAGITGVALFGFVFAHMVGHLQMFLGPNVYNTYAANLQSLGALLWLARGGLLVAVLLHIWATITLVARNRASRPEAYAVDKKTGASLASRTMAYTGPILAVFIVYHLLHFTIGAVDPEVFAVLDARGRPDVYYRMVKSFQNPVMAVAYVVCMGLLCYHLAHGVSSLFRSLGLSTKVWRRVQEQFAVASAVGLFLGFSSVPVAVLLGLIKLP